MSLDVIKFLINALYRRGRYQTCLVLNGAKKSLSVSMNHIVNVGRIGERSVIILYNLAFILEDCCSVFLKFEIFITTEVKKTLMQWVMNFKSIRKLICSFFIAVLLLIFFIVCWNFISISRLLQPYEIELLKWWRLFLTWIRYSTLIRDIELFRKYLSALFHCVHLYDAVSDVVYLGGYDNS